MGFMSGLVSPAFPVGGIGVLRLNLKLARNRTMNLGRLRKYTHTVSFSSTVSDSEVCLLHRHASA